MKALTIMAVALVCVAGVQAQVVIETVTVGNPGNAGELSGAGAGGVGVDRICGAVDYVYDIGKYEVTAGQYTEFLNAVAATDTYGLYNTYMWSRTRGCKIERTGASGSYWYSVAADWANRPVNYVSWGDAARFCNWLHNGQPTGAQDLTTTEDGSYFLDGATSSAALIAIVREPHATWVIPSEDEWYKAAFHKNDGATGNYFGYPTSSNIPPGFIGDGESIPDPDPGNFATYDGDFGTDGIGLPYFRTEVGEHENSASPYGTFDQGGNVYEWTEAVIGIPGRQLRGGSFDFHSYYLRSSVRTGTHILSQNFNGGFRVAVVPEPAARLPLDVKPGSCPNPVNPNSHGVLPVALMGTDEIDVANVDVETVRLSRADGMGGEVAPNEGPPGPHSVFEDVATPFEGEPCDCHDLSTDGIDDLSMKFRADDVVEVLELDDLDSGALVELVVTGNLLDGTPFMASDCVRLVPPGTPPGGLAVESNVAGAWVEVSPLDDTLDGGGFADFERFFPQSTVVTLTAETPIHGRSFRAWRINGVLWTTGQTVVEVTIDESMTARALYRPPTTKNPGTGDQDGWPAPFER